MKKVTELGETSKKVINNNELLEIITLILKKDLKILGKYHYR
ncbi:hypothetical protein [Clostridium puniceum]|nr:hypothetical protein [Clostridium puniceum]